MLLLVHKDNGKNFIGHSVRTSPGNESVALYR